MPYVKNLVRNNQRFLRLYKVIYRDAVQKEWRIIVQTTTPASSP